MVVGFHLGFTRLDSNQVGILKSHTHALTGLKVENVKNIYISSSVISVLFCWQFSVLVVKEYCTSQSSMMCLSLSSVLYFLKHTNSAISYDKERAFQEKRQNYSTRQP